MTLYAQFSGDRQSFQFEVDDDGIIWDPPRPVALWLMGHPMVGVSLMRRKTVLLSDVLLAHSRVSYTWFAPIQADGTPIRVTEALALEIDVSGLSRTAQSIARRAADWSDHFADEKAAEVLGERGRPLPGAAWDALQEAIFSRRTDKQHDRIRRVMAELHESGPEAAQALLDRLIDLNLDDRFVLQRRIRQWPHRLRRSNSTRQTLRRKLQASPRREEPQE